jgi:YVTN family beta-propeller protein
MLRTGLTLCFSLLLFFGVYGQSAEDQNGDATVNKDQLPEIVDLTKDLNADLVNIEAGDEVEGDYIGEMRFTPDGSEVWVLNRITDNITVYDWVTQSIAGNIPVGAMPVDLRFSETHAYIACYSGNELYVVSLENHEDITIIPTAVQPAKLAISPDFSKLVIGCDEPDVAQVLNTSTLTFEQTIDNFPVFIYKFSAITSNPRNTVYWNNFVITPDNNYVVNGGGGDALHFYDLNTGQIANSIPALANTGQIALSGDGTHLITMNTGSDGVVSQVDVATQSLLAQVALSGQSLFSSYSPPAVNMDGSKAFVPANPGNTALIDFEAGDYINVSTGNSPDWVGQSPDYNYAISADFNLAVVDFETGAIMSSLNGTSIQNGIISTSHNRLVATDPLRDEGIYFYDFEAVNDLQQINYAPAGSELEADATYEVRFSPDEQKILAVNSLSGTLSIIDVETESLDRIIPLGSTETFHVDFTSDSRYALVAKRLENHVSIIDLSSGEIIADVSSGGSKPDQVFVLPGDQYAYAINSGAPDRIGVIALDGADSNLETTINIGNTGISWTNFGIRSDLIFDPSKQYAILANPFDEQVQFIDLATHTVVENISVEGFPLQLAVVEDEDLGVLTAVTLKNGSEIGLIAGVGETAALVGAYPCGDNPTRIAYDAESGSMLVTSEGDKAVQFFSLADLSVTDEMTYNNHVPIAVHPVMNQDKRFVLLKSSDSAQYPHLLEVDGEQYELPGIPLQYFDVNNDGTKAAVPLPATDQVVLFKEGPLGWESTLIDLQKELYRLYPNPAVEQVQFELLAGKSIPSQLQFKLRDTSGKLIWEQQLSGQSSFTIDRLPSWGSGVYFYELQYDNLGIQSGKIILK